MFLQVTERGVHPYEPTADLKLLYLKFQEFNHLFFFLRTFEFGF